MKTISFILPCYGSEKTLHPVCDEIRNKVAERKEEYEYEIVAVNDCSPDGVWDVILSLAAEDPQIIGINLAKNMNRPGAVMAGLANCTGDIAVVMDDDGQCPMDELWNLLAPLDGAYDVSMADYPSRKQTVFKDFGTFVNKKMTEFIIERPKDLQFTNFIAMKRYIVTEILKYENPYPYLTGLVLRTTKYICNVPMEERNRLEGGTTFTFKKMVNLWINGFTAFSVKPLRISALLGAIVAFSGFIYGLITIIRKIVLPDIPAGYASIIAVMLFLGGMILLMLGLVGEYIGRIYISINNSPQYVIKERIN